MRSKTTTSDPRPEGPSPPTATFHTRVAAVGLITTVVVLVAACLTFTLQQPGERPATPNDVAAGAYYRITPSVRVGGSVAFGSQDLTPRANQARPADTPKVRLETAFKF